MGDGGGAGEGGEVVVGGVGRRRSGCGSRVIDFAEAASCG